jgi:hypothetical protein
MLLVLLFLCLATGSHAYTRFDTTCTLPTGLVNFVSSPDSRGTLDILWSCLFTIVACTWTIQHLNIPEQRDNLKANMKRRRDRYNFRLENTRFFSRLRYDIKEGIKAFWDDLRCRAEDFWTNLKWMLFTMLAPEFILGKAIGDFVAVWKLRNKMEKYAVTDNVEWGLSHGFFANMGGFRAIVEFDNQKPARKSSAEKLPEIEETLKASESAVEPDENPDGQDIVNSYILAGEAIYELRGDGDIESLPRITTAEIHDKGKANVFVKALVILQVLWICVQVIVRGARGLTISQLELVVTAFSLCAIITYQFLISKPQGVQNPMRPMKIKLRYSRWMRITKRPKFIHSDDWFALRMLVLPISYTPSVRNPPRSRIPNDFVIGGDDSQAPYALGMTLGGVVFGAVHVAAWRFSFPTAIEQKLWRISSILMTCLLPIALLPYILIRSSLTYRLAARRVTFQAWGLVFGFFYIVVRIFLLVETFRTLVYLPPNAFVSTWVSNIPYVG